MSPEAPLLLFDGHCGFCTRSVEWLLHRMKAPLRAIPYQAIEPSDHGLTREQLERAAWLVLPDGTAHSGARAVAGALRACSRPWSVLGWLLGMAPMSWLAQVGYGLVARYRHRLPGVTPACDRTWDLVHGRPA